MSRPALATTLDPVASSSHRRPPARRPERAARREDPTLLDLTPTLLRELQHAHGDPLVTLLLPTTPDVLLGDFDRVRLEALAERAAERLREELPERDVRAFTERIAALTDRIAGEPAGRGLAVFVDDRRAIGVRLPSTLDERVVVDPTFATRDLARCLAATPEYHVLLLGSSRARLLSGRAALVREVHDATFPMLADLAASPDTKGHRLTAERLDRYHRTQRPLVRRAIDAAVLAAGDGPLVVLAPPALAALAREDARVAERVVVGWHDRAPTSRIVELARRCVTDHLEREQDQAVERIERAQRARRCAQGIDAVWSASARGRIELLVVDEAFRYPAWLAPDGRSLIRAFSPDMPEAIDDAVDEVIEQTQRLGRPVVFVGAGRLGADRIAAVLVDR